MTDNINNETVRALVTDALAKPMLPPPPRPKNPNYRPGAWEGKTPEERTAHAKMLRARVRPENLRRGGRKPGTPNGWTKRTFALAEAQASKEADAMLLALNDAGLLPEDAMAREALREVMRILRLPVRDAIRLSAARLLLRYTKRPPTLTRQEVKTAEAVAWLDALIEAEGIAESVHPDVHFGQSQGGADAPSAT